MQIKLINITNVFARRLVLKQSHKVTRKWPREGEFLFYDKGILRKGLFFVDSNDKKGTDKRRISSVQVNLECVLT